MPYRSLFLFCLCFANAIDPLDAETIYDNGPPNRLGGFETTRWIEADDFSLTAASRLENVKFWAFEGSGSFQGSVLWQVYSNSANERPGTLLFSGTSSNLTHTATGFSLFGYNEFLITFDISPVSLPAGTYWLALHNGPLTNDSEQGRVFWGTTSRVGARPSVVLITGNWFSNSVPAGTPCELAFQINGVPEPEIRQFVFDNNVPRVAFSTVMGRIYRVEYTDMLTNETWTPLPGWETVMGTGDVIAASDSGPNVRNSPHRFYRVSLLQL